MRVEWEGEGAESLVGFTTSATIFWAASSARTRHGSLSAGLQQSSKAAICSARDWQGRLKEKKIQLERVDEEQQFEELERCWTQLSIIFDRFFFSFIFFLTGSTTTFLLLLSPRFSYKSLESSRQFSN